MNEEFAQLHREMKRLQRKLAAAIAASDVAQGERLLAETAALERRRNRLVHGLLADQAGPSTTTPLRDQVIAALRLLGWPASVRLVADVAAARFGEFIPTGRMASLRRDEERSWMRAPRARPAYVVPALSSDRLAPVRGVLALSSWPLERRIVAPGSPRVDALRTLDRMVEAMDVEAESPWSSRLRRSVWRLARSVPGALEGGEELDSAAVRAAIAAELAVLEPADTAERAEAAERSEAHADDQSSLFGTRWHVIDGGMVAAGER